MSESFDQVKNLESQSNNLESITISKSSYNKIIVGVVIAIAVSTFFAGILLGSSFNDTESEYLTKSDMENIITALEKKSDNVQPPTAQPTQAQPSAPSLFQVSLDDDPVKGDPEASITIVEFSDFQCPFCSRWYDQTLSSLEENYIDTGKVKLVYRDLPLTSIHPNAMPAHIAAECANEQNKFWDYHNILFESQSEWNRLSSTDLSAKLSEYATIVGIETKSFESCLTSQEMADEVDADSADARRLGATGTPTFFVGNEKDGFTKLVGAQPYSSFKTTIDELLG